MGPAAEDGDGGGGVAYTDLLTDPRVGIIVLTSFIGITGQRQPPPVLPGIAQAFAVPDAQIGLVMTAYFLPGIVVVPLIGVLTDVYGRRRLVLVSYLLFGIGGTAIAFATSFEQILVLRVIQGAGFAGLTPLTIVLIGDLFEGTEASTVQGIRVSGNSAAGIVIPALAGFLAGIAWSVPFFIFALTFPLFVGAYFFLPETFEESGDGLGSARQYVASIRGELTDSNIRLLMLGGFVLFFIKYSILTYAPLYAVRELGVGVFLAGLLLSLRGLVRMVAAPTVGRLAQRFSRHWIFLGAVALGAAGTALVPFAPTFAWLVVVMAVVSAADGVFSPMLNDGVAALASDEQRGGVVSALNVLKMVANTTSPAFFGLVLAGAGFTVMFVLAGVIAFAYVPLAALSLRFE